MTPDYTNARSADGPTVVKWLASRISIGRSEDPWASTVWSWNHANRLVGVEVLDEWLTPVGIHLSELPEDCWRWGRAGSPIRLRDLCERVVSEWLDGAPRKPLARRYKLHPQTVWGWTHDLRYLRDLTRMDEPKGQQADGHGAPVPHPDRAGRNGRPAEPPAPPTISSPVPVADLEGVAA